MRGLLQVLMKRTVLLAKTCPLELRLCYITYRQSQVTQTAITSVYVYTCTSTCAHSILNILTIAYLHNLQLHWLKQQRSSLCGHNLWHTSPPHSQESGGMTNLH